MKALVRQAMEQGAVGVSTSLQYAPAPYATTEELIALASEAAQVRRRLRHPYALARATPSSTRSTRRSASAGRAAFRSRSGTSRPRARTTGGGCRRSWRGSTARAASGIDISADTYAYPAWFNRMSAFVPPWAHDGGDEQLVARLKDPATRARIRKDMRRRATDWDNEWQEIPGPEAILICVVQNPKLCRFRARRWPRSPPMWNTDRSIRCSTSLIEDTPSPRSRCSGCPSPMWRSRCSSPGCRSTTIRRAPRPTACSARSIRIRAPTARSRASCASTSAKITAPLEDAIRKFTALPAQRMRLTDRGVLKQGMWADIVVFDPDQITTRRPSRTPISSRSACSTCSSTAWR